MTVDKENVRLTAIKESIKKISGSERFLAFREIKYLPDILFEDELPEKMISGFYNHGVGLLIATSKRVIFVDKGLVFGLRVEDFPYEKISSVEYQLGLLLGQIRIFASGNRAEIKNTQKDLTRDFCDYVRIRITKDVSSTTNQILNPQIKSSSNVIDKLERLAALKEKGILSTEEFEVQKRSILKETSE